MTNLTGSYLLRRKTVDDSRNIAKLEAKCRERKLINYIENPNSSKSSTVEAAAFDSKSIYMTRRSREIDQIVKELAEFEIHITESGRDTFDDRGKGHHSDLVIALALVVWAADFNGYTGWPMIW